MSEKSIKEYDFAEILKKSICLEQSTQAWCENCEKYQPTVSYSFHSSPTVVHINLKDKIAHKEIFVKVILKNSSLRILFMSIT